MSLEDRQRLAQEIAKELKLDTGWHFGRKNIGFLLETDPSLMELIRKRTATTLGELHIWRVVLRDTTTPEVGEEHVHYVNRFARIAGVGELAVYIRSLKDCPENSVDELFKIMNDKRVREILDWEESGDIPLAKAAMMVVAIASFIDSKSPVEITVLKESSAYVANHLDAVEAILPELISRRAVSKEEIAFLVEGTQTPMSPGLL
jgi:hypothetical protein